LKENVPNVAETVTPFAPGCGPLPGAKPPALGVPNVIEVDPFNRMPVQAGVPPGVYGGRLEVPNVTFCCPPAEPTASPFTPDPAAVIRFVPSLKAALDLPLKSGNDRVPNRAAKNGYVVPLNVDPLQYRYGGTVQAFIQAGTDAVYRSRKLPTGGRSTK
jgi:hypothetical protein